MASVSFLIFSWCYSYWLNLLKNGRSYRRNWVTCQGKSLFLVFSLSDLTVLCSSFLSACGARLVAAIRAALVKGRSSEDEVYAAADESAQELKEKIRQLYRNHKQAASEDRTGISPARVKYSSHSFRPFSLSPYILSKANFFWLCCTMIHWLTFAAVPLKAKGTCNQSRHRLQRPGYFEGASGTSRRRSTESTGSERGRPSLWGPACPQWRRRDFSPHNVQVKYQSLPVCPPLCPLCYQIGFCQSGWHH